MAITKIHPIKSTLKKAIDYIADPAKTDDKLLVSSFGCAVETADLEFEKTRLLAMQKGNNLAHHLIQAFEPGEVSYAQAHEIGRQLADEILGGKYEYVIATHINKEHCHNENNNVEFVGGQAMLLNIYNYFRIEMNSGTILGYFLQALPIACIVGIAFFAIRFAFLKKRKLQIKWKLEILQVIFACYLAGLISLVVLPANFWLGFYDGIFFGWWSEMGQVFQLGVVNLVPSVIICLTGELSLGSWGKTMLIGNIAMFVPFGFFLPLITELKSRKRIVLAAIIVPICFEVAQLFFGRSFDVDDLICNFIGIIIGAMVAYLILKTNSTDVPKGR